MAMQTGNVDDFMMTLLVSCELSVMFGAVPNSSSQSTSRTGFVHDRRWGILMNNNNFSRCEHRSLGEITGKDAAQADNLSV
jgi:hypothetical protein